MLFRGARIALTQSVQINATTFRYALPKDLFKQAPTLQPLPGRACDGSVRWSDAILKSSHGQAASVSESRSPLPLPSKPARSSETPDNRSLHELLSCSPTTNRHTARKSPSPITKSPMPALVGRSSDFVQTSPRCEQHGGVMVARVLEAPRPCAYSPGGTASWNAVPFGYDESVRPILRQAPSLHLSPRTRPLSLGTTLQVDSYDGCRSPILRGGSPHFGRTKRYSVRRMSPPLRDGSRSAPHLEALSADMAIQLPPMLRERCNRLHL